MMPVDPMDYEDSQELGDTSINSSSESTSSGLMLYLTTTDELFTTRIGVIFLLLYAPAIMHSCTMIFFLYSTCHTSTVCVTKHPYLPIRKVS